MSEVCERLVGFEAMMRSLGSVVGPWIGLPVETAESSHGMPTLALLRLKTTWRALKHCFQAGTYRGYAVRKSRGGTASSFRVGCTGCKALGLGVVVFLVVAAGDKL